MRVTKLEGSFVAIDGEPVDNKIELGKSYVYKASFTRKPSNFDLVHLKWAVQYDDGEKIIITGITHFQQLKEDKVLLPLIIKKEFKTARIYAYFRSPSKKKSVELTLKKVKFPMLILQSISRKEKKTEVINGKKISSKETAADLLYGDYVENESGFEKLRKEIYDETYTVEAKKGSNRTTCKENAKVISDHIIEKIKKYSKRSDKELFEDFRDDATRFFSLKKLEDNIVSMIQKMKNKEGGEYSNTDLTNAVIEHENTKKFIANVKKWVVKYLKSDKFKNNSEELRITDDSEGIIYHSDFKEKVDKPRFNDFMDKFEGIQVAINDVWAYQISLTEYYLKDGEPHGKLQFDFYDHFGLDYPDLQKYDNDIFIAWFILQHFRGYKPFITKISFSSKF